jgi:phage terminase large subunit-like protein
MNTEGIYFDVPTVEQAFAFVECLTLTKSTKSGLPEPFKLLKFQKKFIGNILGWKRADGRRLYRKAFLTMARKNGKTQLVAALGLILLMLDDEAMPEVYAAAKTSEQSEKIFEAAAYMVDASEELQEYLTVTPYRREIVCNLNGGKFKALTSDGKAKHGSNPSALLIDELHVWGAREEELYKALTTGRGARKQPLIVFITTAGTDEQSMCYREYSYAKQVLAGKKGIEDPYYYADIYEVPKDADWTDRSLWHLGSPALGEFLNLDIIAEDMEQALRVPSLQNERRQLYLNQWTNTASTWIQLTAWDACSWSPSDPSPAAAA